MSKDDISLEGVSNPAQEAGDVQAEDASQKEVCPAQEAEDFQEDDASLEEADPAQETGNTQADVSLEYKPSRRSRAKLTPLRGLLMAGVIFVVPWIIWGERQDLAYFFTSSVPIDLGLASDYRLASPGETTKAQDFEDNRLIRIEGYPMRQVAIRMQDNPVTPARNRLIYQLLGSSIYVQEDFENSKYAQFFAATHDTPGQSGRGAAVEVTGRLRRFDVSQSKRYAAVREHYSQRYGTVFCQEMTQAERLRRAALLGKGGVALQIMPDGSILSGETGTTATLTSALPLRGRHAMVVGNGNTLLHTSDAGLTWRQTKLPFTSQVTSMTFDTSRDAVLFGARGGWVGGIEEVRDDVLLNIAQDVHSLAYVPAEDANPASLLAVGKEGLVQVAFADREGWLPAQIEARQVLHDILHTGNRWFVAGGQGLLMTQTTDGLA
ncbi:MAG: hypothetical protein FWC40_06855, partial [Proteobacteria bacterium]|nr:hypothetical protein [Pseudomonadota bacterium]